MKSPDKYMSELEGLHNRIGQLLVMPVLLMQSKSLLASYPLRLLLVNLRDYYTQNNMTNSYDE